MNAPIDSSSPSVALHDGELHAHAQLAGPREERRADKRAPLRGNAEDRRGRQRMQPAVALDVGEAGRFGRDEAILQPQLLAQADAFGLLHQQRIGPRVDREAVDLFAEHDAARPRLPASSKVKEMPRRWSSNATERPAMPPPTMTTCARAAIRCVRTRSSSIAMNVGDEFSDSVRRSDAPARLRGGAWPARRCRRGSRCDRRRSRSGRPETAGRPRPRARESARRRRGRSTVPAFVRRSGTRGRIARCPRPPRPPRAVAATSSA